MPSVDLTAGTGPVTLSIRSGPPPRDTTLDRLVANQDIRDEASEILDRLDSYIFGIYKVSTSKPYSLEYRRSRDKVLERVEHMLETRVLPVPLASAAMLEAEKAELDWLEAKCGWLRSRNWQNSGMVLCKAVMPRILRGERPPPAIKLD